MLDSAFWDEHREELFAIFFPLIRDAAMSSADFWLDDLISQAGVGVDWTLVNQGVIKWAQEYSYELIKGINDTSRNAVSDALADWIASGLPLDELIDSLKPMYGPVRAQMIAVTETTRAFSEGQNVLWTESGVVTGYNVYTANDSDVDDICVEAADGGPYPLDDDEHEPPLHIRCRCFKQPVVSVA